MTACLRLAHPSARRRLVGLFGLAVFVCKHFALRTPNRAFVHSRQKGWLSSDPLPAAHLRAPYAHGRVWYVLQGLFGALWYSLSRFHAPPRDHARVTAPEPKICWSLRDIAAACPTASTLWQFYSGFAVDRVPANHCSQCGSTKRTILGVLPLSGVRGPGGPYGAQQHVSQTHTSCWWHKPRALP